MSGHFYSHKAPWDLNRPSVDVPFIKPSDTWQFVDEYITAVGSECYPWDPRIIKEIRAVEPDFCPLWVVSVYMSPAKTLHRFGRHAVGIDTRHHIQEGQHVPLKVWGASYGVNAGRRPIVVSDILQDKSERIVPELSVYGYRPFTWREVRNAQQHAWEERQKKKLDTEAAAERDATDIRDYQRAEAKRASDALNAEVDYRWENDKTSQKLRALAQSLTHEDMRSIKAPAGARRDE